MHGLTSRGCVDDVLNGAGQTAFVVGVPDERVQQLGPIGKVQIERLTRNLRLLGNVRHRDTSFAAHHDQIPGRLENAAPGRT